MCVDETLPPNCAPSRCAVALAVRKAHRAGELRPDSLILGADTLVESNGSLLGKPASAEHARETLRKLSGREHRVITGVSLHARREGRTTCRSVTTLVEFRRLGEEEIEAYVATGEPFDKAGGYAIQGGGERFVNHIDGPFDNVVGLPVGTLIDMLEEW